MPLQTDAQKQVASSHTNVLDALLALSLFAQQTDMHIDAIRTVIDLRCPQLYELDQVKTE